jgi:diaminohydroxyphosphoribosylaminopyrimidine deaminase/5-amino-6-(5-phosphoribosylamino)uracil reductase
MVGAVLIKGGVPVGEGWHKGIGTDHAETMAFAKAGALARGATLYVNLEPCAHFFSSIGQPRLPCAERCVRAGVARVVCAMEDPDSRVAGRGFAYLREAGIDVVVGVEEVAARALNHAYIRHRMTGLPFITHKAAMTLDGKIAAPDGSSQWITGEQARKYVHRLRHRSDAILVGVGTVLMDDPSLTTRVPSGNGRDPVRVILDSALRIPVTARVVRAGTVVLTTDRADQANRHALEDSGVEVIEVEKDRNGRVAVVPAMRLLADRGMLSVLLESGGELAGSLYEADLVNRLVFFVAPKLVGGLGSTPIGGGGITLAMKDAKNTGPLTIRRFGQDIAIETELGNILTG